MTTELQKLDEEIARIPASPNDEDFNRRAELMRRRGELDQTIRAAANVRPEPRGNLVVVVPPGLGISHVYGNSGRVVRSRVNEEGLLVLDLYPTELKSFLLCNKNGMAWEAANAAALQQLAVM